MSSFDGGGGGGLLALAVLLVLPLTLGWSASPAHSVNFSARQRVTAPCSSQDLKCIRQVDKISDWRQQPMRGRVQLQLRPPRRGSEDSRINDGGGSGVVIGAPQYHQRQRMSRLHLSSVARGGGATTNDDGDDRSGDGNVVSITNVTSSTSTTSSLTSSSEESSSFTRRRRLSVAAVLASAFLNLLGFTMAGPITPALGQHFHLAVGASFGSLTSAYPMGMLLGLFLWPQLSDRVGRKPVIALSLLGSGLGLAAQAAVVRANLGLGVFLAARVLTGSLAGSSPVSKAYLADLGAAEGKLPRYLALRDAACTMAFIVGPVLGGVMYDVRRRLLGYVAEGGGAAAALAAAELGTTESLAFVIGVSAGASLGAAALVALLMTELPARLVKQASKKKKKDVNTAAGGKLLVVEDDETTTTSTTEELELIACPLGRRMWTGVATVCVVSFLFNVGDSTFHAFFSALLRDSLGLDARSIGLSYTIFACISFAMSATVSSRLVKNWGPVPTCVAGLSACGAGLMALSPSTSAAAATAARTAMVLGAAALYYCGVPLYGPTIPTMLLRCVPPYRRGAVMGLDGAINTMARVVSPLLMGELYRRSGAGAAFGVAGGLVFFAGATAMFRRLVVLRGQQYIPVVKTE